MSRTDHGLPGIYNASPLTLPDGAGAALALDQSGNSLESLATTIAGEDIANDVLKVEQRFTYNFITTGATTLVKTGAGFLHTIVVTGGTAGTIIVYDNVTGTSPIIASFSSTNAIATYTFDVSFVTGLTIVTSAATQLTVSYR